MRFKETVGISHILRAADHETKQCIDEGLEPLGITSAQYTVLSTLEEHGGCTNADLARKCAVTPQTMNRILQNLERENLIKKTQNDEHALKFDITLSAKGTKTVCDSHIVVNKVEMKMIKKLSEGDLKKLQALLQTCLNNLRGEKG